jgi:hypothetical protein
MTAAPKRPPSTLKVLSLIGIFAVGVGWLLAPTPKDPQVEAAQMTAVQAGDVAGWISANGADCQGHVEDVSAKVYRNGESVEVTSLFNLNGINLNGLEKPSVEGRPSPTGARNVMSKRSLRPSPK